LTIFYYDNINMTDKNITLKDLNENKKVFNRIKEAVKLRNTTIEWLCEQINFSKGTYQTIRKRGQSLDFNVIVAMSNVLNVSLNYLAYGEEKELLKTNSLNLETIKQSAQQILTSIEKIQNPIIEPYQEHSSKIKLTKEPLPPEQDEPFNYINCYGSIAAGTPINLTGEVTDTVAISAKLLTDKAENYFCLHVKGKSMIRAGINDGDTVLLHKADTPIAGKIFAVIDVADDSVTLKRLEVDEEDGNLLLVWLDGSGKTIPLTDKHVVRGEYVRVI
jgi:SOS-response transcriptional repressor LexA